jgi:hypothetical protein
VAAEVTQSQARSAGPLVVATDERTGLMRKTIRFSFAPSVPPPSITSQTKVPTYAVLPWVVSQTPASRPPTRSAWEENLHPWIGLPTDILHLGKGIGVEGRPME